MFSENSLKLIGTMIDGVNLKPSAPEFAIMAQAFEVLKKELQDAMKQVIEAKKTEAQ